MAFDPCVGTEGRVRTGVGNHVVAGVMEWRLNKQLTPIPINHFELTADGDGVVWSAFERGLASATATLRGHYNVDGSDRTEGGAPGIRLGVGVEIDLFFTRAPFGYTNLAGFVSQFEAGTNVENQTGTFTATIQLTGIVGAAA
jgi:hypothetical protein